jgi:hypothetical protein
MTGPLVLPADPTLALQSATKQYVDTGDATGITAIGARAVRYDAAQGLTAAQQVQARQNIYAAPFDALAYSGMQINGSMEVSQEKGAGITSVSGQFILDGWVYYNTSTATVLSGQLVNPVAGLSAGLFMQTTVVQATLTGSQFNAVTHSIEGYRFARMAWGTANAQPLTIAFWSGHHTVGTYSIAVRNGDDTRTCCVTYTQNAADVWEYKTVTVPGDTAGSWPVGNTTGAKIQFANACGPTVTAPAANTWYSAGYVGAPGQVNGVASAAYFKIGGVVVLPGIEAPSAARAPLIMRPYDQELLTCKRYFRQGVAEGAGIATSTTAVQFSINHVGMRVAPTVVAAGVLTITDIIASNYNQSSPNIGITLNSADWGIYLLANYAGLVAGRVYVFRDATGGKVINFDARL